MKKKGIFWGIVMILMAVLVIVSQMGLIEGMGFWTILFSLFFAATLIRAVIKFDMTQILFSIAFLCILWDGVLGIEKITPWPVLLAALLGSIGFSMIFGHRKKKYYKNKYCSDNYTKTNSSTLGDENGRGTVEHDYGEEIQCSVSFGSSVKYVNSENLRSVDVSVSFGSAAIYLDNAKVPAGEVVVNIDVSFGGVELYVPKEWGVTNHMQTSFAGVDEEKRAGENSVNMILVGSASFSGVDIIYV